MDGKIYVGNLPYKITDSKELVDFFKEFNIDEKFIKIIINKQTGEGKGFAFVELPIEQVQEVISKLNGEDLLGRKLIIREARGKDD